MQGRSAIQRELERLEKWADRTLTKLSKGKCQSPDPREEQPKAQDRLGMTSWETALQRDT